MFSNKNHLVMRSMLISTITTFITIITIALFALLFLNFVGILLGAFSTSASAASYTASISTSGNINLDVSSAGNGANITTDNVGIVSTCPSGYNVSIAAKSATNTSFSDTTLYKDGDKTNTADTKKINPSTGTIASPVSILGNNNKTWGYTIQSIAGEENPVGVNSNFVGLTTTPAIINTSTSGTGDSGTTLPVYYGVSVDNTIEPGLYKMSDDAVITYYLTTSLDCTSYQVAFNPTSTAGGQTLSGTGTMDNQRISEGVATALTANAFTAPTVSGKTYYFAGWNTAQDGTGTTYTNQQQVTDLTTVGNTITLYAQWTDCPANKVCYDPNGVSTPTTMSNQSISTSATSINLWASNFQNKNYGFAGWSTEPIVPELDGDSSVIRKKNIPASVSVYGPNETISITAGQYSNAGLKLYAIWIEMDDAQTMQTWAEYGYCNRLLDIGDVTAVMDGRDGQTYAVAKLADGNCWMIENLRLDNQYTTGDFNKNRAQGYNSSFIGLADPETANFSNSTTANSLYSIDGSTSAPAITGDNQGYRFPRYNNDNTNSTVANMTRTNDNVYSYGNYYTWHAAIADTTYYSSGDHNTTSICPTGWQLPLGDTSTGDIEQGAADAANKVGGFSYLDRKMGGTGQTQSTAADSLRWIKFPVNFLYSGYFNTSSALDRVNNGNYWSSTANSNGYSYNLYLNRLNVYPGTSEDNKNYGYSIRCVATEAPAPANTVQYNPNGSDVEGTMGDQTITSSDTSLTLLASNFSRTGYGFVGWSEDKNVTNSSKIYGPQEDISFAAGTYASAGLKLYAVWVASAGSLQDTAKVAELCGTGTNALTTAPADGTANLSSVSALTDQRDNQTYAIAKLADGNCWMIENLRLESTNSDNSTGNLAQGYGTSTTYGNFSGLADAESTGFTGTYTANSLYYSGTKEGTASIDIGTSNDPAFRMPRYNNTNTIARASSPTTNGVAMYSYGNYYTWHAAIADLTYNDTNNQSTTGTSLCPAGWRLPQGGDKTKIESNDDNDFWNLTVDALNGGVNPANYDSLTRPYYSGTAEAGPVANKLRSFPNNFLYSGIFNRSSAGNRGSYGFYWSSTAYTTNYSDRLNLGSSNVYPGADYHSKYYGLSIRCTVSAGT